MNALAAAQEVLVTVESHVMALSGLTRLLETLEVVKERLNPDIKMAGILACRVDARTRHAQEVVEQLRSRFGSLVYKTLIRENVRLAECPSFCQPITLYDPQCNGAADYRQLATRSHPAGERTKGIRCRRSREFRTMPHEGRGIMAKRKTIRVNPLDTLVPEPTTRRTGVPPPAAAKTRSAGPASVIARAPTRGGSPETKTAMHPHQPHRIHNRPLLPIS